MQLTAWLKSFFKYEPAVLAWGLNGGIALVFAFLFHLNKTGEASVATIVTAAAALYTAFLARPVSVSAVTGIVGTIAGALAVFKYHPSAELVALIDAGLAVVLPLLARPNVTPLAALKAGLKARPLTVRVVPQRARSVA